MDTNMNLDIAILMSSTIGILGGALLVALVIRAWGNLLDAFKAGELVFQLPIRTNKAYFSDWEFEQVFDKRSGKSELTITVQTNRGEVILPTLLVSDWSAFLSALPGAKSNNSKNNHGQTGTQGHNQSSKKSKSNNGFLGKAKVVAPQVLTISPKQDLYPNQRIKLSDGTVAQILTIQLNGQDVQKAQAGQHVGIGLDVNAIAGAVQKA